MRLVEFLLLENRVDFLRKQFQDKIWFKAHEMEHNGPGAIKPELFFDILLLADPTQDKKYAQWVIRSYLRGTFRREDIDRIKGWLKRFDEIKPKLEPQQRDIMQYKDPSDLYLRVIQPMRKLDATSQRQIDKAIDAQLKAQVRVVYKGPEGAVYVPTTEEASCYLGRGTQWCTAATESHNAFHDYNREGPLYIVMTPDGRKVQMHFESEQFMDENDKSIPVFPAKYKSIRLEPAEEHQKFSLAHNYRWLAKIPEIAKKAELNGAVWMFENPSSEMRKNAIRKTWRNVFDFPNPTEDEIELAMSRIAPHQGARKAGLDEIIKKFPNLSERLKLHAVALSPESIRYMVDPSPVVQRYVAQHSPDLIQLIKNQDPRAMKIAVRSTPRTIAHVKDQTPELQKMAVSAMASTIMDISKPTRAVMEIAAKKSPEYLLRASTLFKYVIPDDLQIVMVTTHPKLMRQIDNPSQRVIDAYNAWLDTFDEDAQRYIGGKFVPPKMKAAESRGRSFREDYNPNEVHYGYWIKPNGEIIPVGNAAHESTVTRHPDLLGLHRAGAQYWTDTALRNGWIRVMDTPAGYWANQDYSEFNFSMGIPETQVNPAAMKSLIRVLQNAPGDTKVLADLYGHQRSKQGRKPDFLRFLHRILQQNGMDKVQAAESIMCESVEHFYHVTPTRNLKRIKAEGLIPNRGPRSRRLGEPGSSIYLFTSMEEMEDALMNWLGDEFGEDTQLAILQITPPPGVQFTPSRGAEWEAQTNQPIPPEYIRVLRIE